MIQMHRLPQKHKQPTGKKIGPIDAERNEHRHYTVVAHTHTLARIIRCHQSCITILITLNRTPSSQRNGFSSAAAVCFFLSLARTIQNCAYPLLSERTQLYPSYSCYVACARVFFLSVRSFNSSFGCCTLSSFVHWKQKYMVVILGTGQTKKAKFPKIFFFRFLLLQFETLTKLLCQTQPHCAAVRVGNAFLL